MSLNRSCTNFRAEYDETNQETNQGTNQGLRHYYDARFRHAIAKRSKAKCKAKRSKANCKAKRSELQTPSHTPNRSADFRGILFDTFDFLLLFWGDSFGDDLNCYRLFHGSSIQDWRPLL